MQHLFDPKSVADFLAIWGHGPHSLCWVDSGAFRFTFCHSPLEMLDQVAALPDTDIWFGAHPLKGIPERGRGGRDDVAQVVAIPADLDWAHPTRRTDKPLPSEAEVRSGLIRLGPELQPSIVVNSGQGLQVWWLLTYPLGLEEAEDLIGPSPRPRWRSSWYAAGSWVQIVSSARNDRRRGDPLRLIDAVLFRRAHWTRSRSAPAVRSAYRQIRFADRQVYTAADAGRAPQHTSRTPDTARSRCGLDQAASPQIPPLPRARTLVMLRSAVPSSLR